MNTGDNNGSDNGNRNHGDNNGNNNGKSLKALTHWRPTLHSNHSHNFITCPCRQQQCWRHEWRQQR